ncbi:MAG: hypothetical protein M3Y24_03865 [Acidobacteriota bacterium]|nr:hypothetical protein [Acidobacteriota bacterium]
MSKRKLFLLILTWILAAVAILPAIFQWQPTPPATGHRAHLQFDFAYLIALLITAWMYRVERRRLTAPQAFGLVFLVFALTSVTNSVHRFYVDHASLYPPGSNLHWQIDLQKNVIDLLPAVAPHSYRFLPNALVRWMEISGFSFDAARDVYRLLVGLLLFYAIYRYARLFTDYLGAVIALVLVATVYPISFEYYMGQLTDPLSHLSFVLAFIFLETNEFAFLLTTLILGSLAKETVLAMAGSYILFCRRDREYLVKAAALCVGVIGAFAGVRMFVLRKASQYKYEQVSGVSLAHLSANWHNGRWQAVLFLTVGVMTPFLVLAWRETPLALKRQVLFLFPVLFISSLFFSWLNEARNYMPVVFILAVVAGNYFGHVLSYPAALKDSLLPLKAAESTDVGD